jgi:hypothetical protein
MEPFQDNQIQSTPISVELPSEVLPNQKPSKFFDIPQKVIDSFSAYMQVVLQMSEGTKHQEEIKVKEVLVNTQNMFRDGFKHNDNFWMQHVAISLREIVGFINIDGEDFYKAHSSIPTYATNQDIKEQLDKIILMRSYFSDIVHFVPGNRLGIMHKIYPNDGYQTMRKEKFFQDEETIFEKVCIDFIYLINDIFIKKCVGVVKEEVKKNETN